jgi:FkbM family methyltransferase
VFVVTIFNPSFAYADARAALEGAGCRSVCPWTLLAWEHPDGLLPYYALDLPQHVLEQREAVRAAHDLLADERSRAEYRAQVAWRLTNDTSIIGAGEPPSDQYLSPDLVRLHGDDVFVDGGAFDGDTVASLVAHAGRDFARIVALEPDPATRRALAERVEALPAYVRERVEVLPYAVGAQRGSARWGGAGQSAHVADDGEIEVEIAPLDELLADTAPTYVKLDIEGAELDALAGAAEVVRRHRPVLGLCAYHRQDHLWRVPLAVDALVDGYHYAMRRYACDNFDVVLYAIPAERPGAG